MAGGFRLDIESVLTGLANFESKAKAAVSLYGDTASKKLEKEAKENARWIDRTGLSRKTIQGGSQWDGNKNVIYIAGNTPQFVYLELAHDKKYAILQPTVDKLAPSILRGMGNLLK
jgi:hypothetical protein